MSHDLANTGHSTRPVNQAPSSGEPGQRGYESSRRSPAATEGAWCSRLVVQDAFDLLHHFGSQLLRELDRLDIVVDLVRLGGAEDHLDESDMLHHGKVGAGMARAYRADVGVLDAPRKAQLADVAAKLLRELRQLHKS